MTDYSQQLTELSARLARVEREMDRARGQLRWAKGIGLAGVLLLGTVSLVAADRPQPKTPASDGIVLKDDDGNVRGELSVRNGAAALVLFDEAKVPRVVLTAGKDLAGL